MYIYYNPNPSMRQTGDCVIRGIARLTGMDWDETYAHIVMQGFIMKDMPSSNNVWGEYLRSRGFRRHVVPDTCPACYTVEDFCREHPKGSFLLATGTHVVAVMDGSYYDTWDSGQEIPVYYWQKGGDENGIPNTDASAAGDNDDPHTGGASGK